jgi:4-amino-4-deoxy-L-arabinose transferase-like glycosyltransferase
MFAGGIALGLAVLIKPVFGPFVLLPMVLVADQVRGREWRLAMLSVTALAVGMAIPIGATVGWFAHHGALADLMEAYLLYPQQIYAASVQQSWSSLLTEMGRALTPGKILFVMLPFAVFGARSLDTSARRPMVLLVLWSVLALAAVIVQKRFFLYHWLPIYPPLAILFGMGIYRLQCAAASDHLSLRVRRLALSAGLVVILMHVAAHPLFDLYSSAAYAAGYRSRDLYLQSFGIPADEVAAAERLAQLSTPDDYVLVWGWNTNVLYLADRKSPTRFGFSMPLLLGPGTDVRDRYRAEFMRALGNTPIKYIILGEIAETILGGKVDLSDFPEFYDYLVENFQSNGDIGRVQIWTARKRPVADETVTTR